jgi:putative tributyrin esterase
MAKSVLNFHSEVLGFHTTVCIAYPEPQTYGAPDGGPSDAAMPVLYLLHGMHGGAHSFLSNTNVERYLHESKQKMVVVMPEMGNDCYTDQRIGWKYLSYVAQELPRIVETFLRVSPLREDTFVAGYSMGGYGAMKMALTYPEKFGFAASFSGNLDLEALLRVCATPQAGAQTDEAQTGEEMARISEFIFGGADAIRGSENDLFHLLKALDGEGKEKPELYVSCGTADGLHAQNRRFYDAAKALGYDITFFEEHDEGHAWRFWDKETEKLMRTLL